MLYIVATPIGNLDELSPRAVKILQSVDVIAAEDTRHSRRLCQSFSIKTPLIAYHQHNEQQRTPQLIERLQQGDSIALISDAGMPLISDPGYRLIKQIRERQIIDSKSKTSIEVISGPCALINALAGSGLATDTFSFEGFLSSKASAREKQLQQLCLEARTMAFYESPHRLSATLIAMAGHFGNQRQACVARELTKLHESWYCQSLGELADFFDNNSDHCRGEIVIVVEGATNSPDTDYIATADILSVVKSELPPNKAATILAKLTGRSKKIIYQELINSH